MTKAQKAFDFITDRINNGFTVMISNHMKSTQVSPKTLFLTASAHFKGDYLMRILTAKIIAPIMAMTGFRFSKSYRHEDTRYHALVYAIVSTPIANSCADKWVA